MTEMQHLDEATCYELLKTTDIGRFAVISGRYPVVFPVNYTLDDNTITFRTGQGTKLRAAFLGDVSFEVDFVSPDRTSAWSVLVFGSVDHNGISLDELDKRDQLDVHPIDPANKPAWVRINAHRVTGRMYTDTKGSTPAFDTHAYL